MQILRKSFLHLNCEQISKDYFLTRVKVLFIRKIIALFVMIIRAKQSYINIIREMNCMNEKEFIDDFVINPLTLAILPMEYEGKLYSKSVSA